MRDPSNIDQVVNLKPDFMGFIFYPKSKRFVGDHSVDLTKRVPRHIKKVGVFVNASIDHVTSKIKEHDLDFVQVHGGESVEYCQKLHNKGIKIIKVFSIDDSGEPLKLKNYAKVTDMFLFDTMTKDYGGSGQKFNWNILESMAIHKPFLLSGGIGPEDTALLNMLNHPFFYGVDLNSRFEDKPAQKNIEVLKAFIEKIRGKNEIHC